METILDGSGKGYTAKVDDEGRLHVDSINTPRDESQAQRGFSYNVNTGNITLTNAATENAVLYLKNNEDFDVVVTNIFYLIGNSTGGSGNIYVDVVRNPTTGTIVSGATAVDVTQNRNFGSSRALSVTAYKGATGLTFTNGDDILKTIINTGAQRIALAAGALTLPKGSSIGINFTTPTGNTSMICQFAIACYVEDEKHQFA